jgi:hypothetical protein
MISELDPVHARIRARRQRNHRTLMLDFTNQQQEASSFFQGSEIIFRRREIVESGCEASMPGGTFRTRDGHAHASQSIIP